MSVGLEELRRELKPSDVTGLACAASMSRPQIYFGPEYGLKIDCQEDQSLRQPLDSTPGAGRTYQHEKTFYGLVLIGLASLLALSLWLNPACSDHYIVSCLPSSKALSHPYNPSKSWQVSKLQSIPPDDRDFKPWLYRMC